jgi:hypothetical protein
VKRGRATPWRKTRHVESLPLKLTAAIKIFDPVVIKKFDPAVAKEFRLARQGLPTPVPRTFDFRVKIL